MTHLLDTDHVSILEYPVGPVYAAVAANMARHATGDVGVSVVSLHEQVRGCHNQINQARTPADVVRGYRRLADVFDLFRRFPLAPFDPAAAAEFDRLRAAKIRVGTLDLRIAATALANNLTVVTRNVSDFGQVPGLRTEDWTR